MLKHCLAVSLVLAFVSGGMTPVQAHDASGLSLSPNPAWVNDTPYQTSYYDNDNIALRGRVSTIPKGTMMMVKMDRPLSSYSSSVGDAVSAQVETDVFLNNQVIVPAGSTVEGRVSGVTSSGHLGRSGAIELRFHAIKSPSGQLIPMEAFVVTPDNTGIIKGDTDQARVLKSLGTAAGSAAAGTLMGTAAGSILGSAGSGASFGLAAGSLVGIGYAVVREGKPVVIPSGARLSIVTAESANIQ